VPFSFTICRKSSFLRTWFGTPFSLSMLKHSFTTADGYLSVWSKPNEEPMVTEFLNSDRQAVIKLLFLSPPYGKLEVISDPIRGATFRLLTETSPGFGSKEPCNEAVEPQAMSRTLDLLSKFETAEVNIPQTASVW